MMPPPVASSSSSQLTTTPVASVSDCIKVATLEQNPDKRRIIFEDAFQLMKQHPNTQMLCDLLYAYADQTCYNQVKGTDKEYGYRASACLLELAVCLQLDKNYPWATFDTIEKLVESLGVAKDQKSHFLDAIAQLPEHSVPPKSKSFTSAFIKLAYSYQNIDARQDLALHTKLDTIVKGLLDDETEKLIDYMYNRAAFMSDLVKPDDYQAQFDSYEPVLAMIKKHYRGDEPQAKSLLTQITNMQGLCLYRAGKGHQVALPYFQKAYTERQALVAMHEKSDPRYWEQNRLLKNLTTTLLTLHTRHGGAEAKPQVIALMNWLLEFIKEAQARNDNHAYDDGDVALLKKVSEFLLP